ncbi:tRNA (adenosine(37)-N6)-dimethylallyltransferase MiaA [Nitrosomonadales bacterium]|nr:tRNA (adenosine(37)-N6)-dimethylallyltransferase MiaA [Nitrosomonadales bacterium]
MYFNSLEKPINNLPVSTNQSKKQVNDELVKKGINFLFKKLKKIDPILSKKIDPNDSQRIQRGLEVYYISGKPLSSFYNENIPEDKRYNLLKLALWPKDREKLHNVIEDRVSLMLKNGLIEEVEGILKIYPNITDSYPSFRSVGYRQTFNYLKNLIPKKELKDRLIFATRQLAKRQMTWMKKMDNLEIFEPFDKQLSKDINNRIEIFLTKK